MSWDCSVSNAENLTVGSPFVLSCSGAPVSLDQQKLVITTVEGDPLTLHLLEAKKFSPEGMDGLVTGYRPIAATDMTFLLTDGAGRVELQKVTYTVKSVIKDPKQEPYPGYPPWVMSFPLWLWLGLLAIWLIVVGLIIRFVYVRSRDAKLFKAALAYRTNRSAMDEYFKDVRAVEKKLETQMISEAGLVAELEQILRLYLTRQFGIPAHAWSLGRTLKYLQRNQQRLFRIEGIRIKSTIAEIEKSKSTQLSKKDISQLMRMIAAMAEGIHSFDKKGSRP